MGIKTTVLFNSSHPFISIGNPKTETKNTQDETQKTRNNQGSEKREKQKGSYNGWAQTKGKSTNALVIFFFFFQI